jgi:predicted nucleic acid-binding protein
MVIVDSSVWIDLLGRWQNPETAWLQREVPQRALGLTDLTLCEVLQGVRVDAMFGQVRSSLLEFEIFDCGGMSLAISSAENYRSLRARGITSVRRSIVSLPHSALEKDIPCCIGGDFEPFERYLGLKAIRP